jgi:preprotein translocase subunit YajC
MLSVVWGPSIAWAATESAAPAPNPMSQFIMLGAFIFIFYFLLWRPQSKRAKEHRNLISNLAKGDEVLTTGGLVGKITKLDEPFLTLAIANGIEVQVQRTMISSSLPKGTLQV